MKGATFVLIAVCLALVGCAPQPPAPVTETPSQTVPARPNIVGSWDATRDMPIAGKSLPASTSAVFGQDGSLQLRADAVVFGNLFTAKGSWRPSPDGRGFEVKVQDATSTALVRDDRMLWLGSIWHRR